MTEVSVSKVWDDEDDAAGIRPASITVRLHANGKPVDQATLNEAGGWTYAFTGLHKYEGGAEIHYTITEDAIPEYSTKIDEKTFTITNYYTPGETSVEVSKVWEDANDAAGMRPAFVQVQLLADGEAYGSPVELSEANDWVYIWDELPEDKDGKAIVYTVEELTNAKRYTKAISGDAVTGFIVTNTYEAPSGRDGGKGSGSPSYDPPADPSADPPADPSEDPGESIDDPDTPLADLDENTTDVDTNEDPNAGFSEEEEEMVDEDLPLTPFTGDDRRTDLWAFLSLLSLAGIALLGRRREE